MSNSASTNAVSAPTYPAAFGVSRAIAFSAKAKLEALLAFPDSMSELDKKSVRDAIKKLEEIESLVVKPRQ